MRRADRLFQLVQLVRGRRLSTGEWLAGRLQVSLRTVYRDVADLQAQGVPLEGEAGVGYRLRAGFDLPPLMFSIGEAKALVACVRLAGNRLDPELAGDAELALAKIIGVLPPAARAAAESLALHAPVSPLDAATRERLLLLRRATESRRKLEIRYAGRCQRARRAAARLLPLGRGVDAGRLVRAARGLPQLPRRPAGRRAVQRRHLPRRTGPYAGRPVPARGLLRRPAVAQKWIVIASTTT